jgi:hypothetical protein
MWVGVLCNEVLNFTPSALLEWLEGILYSIVSISIIIINKSGIKKELNYSFFGAQPCYVAILVNKILKGLSRYKHHFKCRVETKMQLNLLFSSVDKLILP